MSTRPDTQRSDSPSGSSEIVLYTRPGCPYCFTLRAGLRRAGIVHREINIWEDPDAAAFVRSVANGNETVPTVVVGDVHMVNPSARRVRAVAGHARCLPSPKRRHWFRRSARTGETP
jgi:mycoredoxin